MTRRLVIIILGLALGLLISGCEELPVAIKDKVDLQAKAEHAISWSEDEVEFELEPGASKTVTVTLTANTNLEGATLRLTPSLDELVSISPTGTFNLDAGAVLIVTLKTSVPADAKREGRGGTLTVRVGDRALAEPMEISVKVRTEGEKEREGVSWNPDEIEVQLSPGKSRQVTTTLSTNVPLTNATLMVSPSISSFVQILQPTSPFNLQPGQQRAVSLNISLPADARAEEYSGRIEVRMNDQSIPEALKVKIENEEAERNKRKEGTVIHWSDDDVEFELEPGLQSKATVSFTTDIGLTAAELRLTPSLADLVTVAPTGTFDLAAGSTMTITLTAKAPGDVRGRGNGGTLTVRLGDRALAEPLQIKVRIGPKEEKRSRVSWSPDEIEMELLPGKSKQVTTTLSTNITLTNATLMVSPSISSFVQILQPASPFNLQPEQEQAVRLNILLPADAKAKQYRGQIEVRVNGETIPKELKVRIENEADVEREKKREAKVSWSPDEIELKLSPEQSRQVTATLSTNVTITNVLLKVSEALSRVLQILQPSGPFTLGPNNDLQVRMNISLPSDAAVRDYRGTVAVQLGDRPLQESLKVKVDAEGEKGLRGEDDRRGKDEAEDDKDDDDDKGREAREPEERRDRDQDRDRDKEDRQR